MMYDLSDIVIGCGVSTQVNVKSSTNYVVVCAIK